MLQQRLLQLHERLSQLLHRLQPPPRRARGSFFAEAWGDTLVPWGPHPVPHDLLLRGAVVNFAFEICDRSRETRIMRSFARSLLQGDDGVVDLEAETAFVARTLMMPTAQFRSDMRATGNDVAQLLALYPFVTRELVLERMRDIGPVLCLVRAGARERVRPASGA